MFEKEQRAYKADQGKAPSKAGSSDDAMKNWMLSGHHRIAGLAFWEWDFVTGYIFFSPEWQNILQSGEYDQAVPGDESWWWQRIHEEDKPMILAARSAIEERRSNQYDVRFRLQRADGCWAWLLTKGAVTAVSGDSVVKVSGVVMDISSLRTDPVFQMSEAVGNAAYHAMLENSPDMFVRMDRELFPAYMNPVVAEYMGRDRDQYSYSESLEELKIQPQQLEFLQRNVRRVFDERATSREMISFIDATGREVTGEYSFWPEFDGDGKVTYAMTQFRDLSHQVQAEQHARINEKRLEALNRLTLMDNVAEAEVLSFVMSQLKELTRSKSGFIFIPRGESPFEGEMLWSDDHYNFLDRCYLPHDILPEDLIALARDADGSLRFCSVRNGDGIHPIQVSFDGQMPIMRSMIAPAMDGERVACIAGVCNKEKDYDEADLRQLETFINGAWLVIHRQRFLRELRRAKEAAEHANRVKDTFLANVSHELRTPLNGMLSMMQLLELLPMTEQQREYVYAANESGRALLRIISDILDFSHMESGRMQLRKEEFNFKETVCSTMRLFSSEAIKKGLATRFFIDDAIPGLVIGDEARVRQILFNIVGNALKFTEKGEITLQCSLVSAEGETRPRVHIALSDTGIGIPREKRDAVFEAFTQLDSSSTRRYAGTGLGLDIVRQLVTLMDGSVFIDSEVGKGTTVHCVLRFDACAPEAGQPDKAWPALHPERQGLDILVAEDDKVSRFAIRSFLQRAGHRPYCVSNGREALEALLLHPFDCLFTDIQMPDMDGLEVTRRVRSKDFSGVIASRQRQEELAAYRANGPAHLGVDEEQSPGTQAALAACDGVAQGDCDVDASLTIVAVSAHAMSGDRERFLEQGVDYYVSKPIRMEELGQVLSAIGARRKERNSH